jgi:cytochrome c-type biogenesis protein CcmH
MTLFWVLGAGVVLVALAWVLRPLLWKNNGGRLSRNAVNVSIYRDQQRELEADVAAGTLAREDYERARAELEGRLLQDVAQPDAPAMRTAGRSAAWVVGAGIPLLVLALYLSVGSPGAIEREEMFDRLAAHLRANPDDVGGWKLLARAYAVQGRFEDAAAAYAKAALRAPRDAQLLVDFADVLAMAHGQSLQGEPEKLVLRALELEPANLKGLALAGTAAYERKDFAGAAAHWEKMLPLVPPDSEGARAIRENVAEAKSKQKASAGAALRGTVSLSPKLKDKAALDDTVFVFARAAEGPAMPLAVARVRVRDLPYRFSLDDSMAMTPAMKLSAHPRVIVTARVSKSGNASAQPGDLQGASAPVANDAASVSVVIDSPVR